MSKQELFKEFHDEIAQTSTEQMQCLHDLAADGSFIREAGPEFVLAVNEVWDERH